MKKNKSLWQIFNDKVDQWTEALQQEATEIIIDRQRLYEMEIPVEMREGMNRLDHEAKGKMLQWQFNNLQKGGVRGALTAIDVRLYHGKKRYFSDDNASKQNGPS